MSLFTEACKEHVSKHLPYLGSINKDEAPVSEKKVKNTFVLANAITA